ncbi:MAG TPA: SRPBCC domain-containing protein [Solirubrobacteraceae bacterium]|nr:SRPBCC domain-containing protein [Solirubrobacteraceae bacterium]
MPVGTTTVERSRVVAAAPERIWRLVADPHHQPRWWPGVERMEGVEGDRFTQVLRTRRGRAVRVDYSVIAARAGELVVWRQELEGSPFARVLSAAEIRIALRPCAAGTRVSITHVQRLRGSNRTGGWMLARATRRRSEEALSRLAELL